MTRSLSRRCWLNPETPLCETIMRRALFWRLVAPLAVLCAVVEAAFTPRNRTELQTATFGCVGACGQALALNPANMTYCDPSANDPWEEGNGICNNSNTNVPTGQGNGLYGVIGAWNVSNVTSMHNMFYSALQDHSWSSPSLFSQ